MLTFLELYQTLLGFAFFKLFTDINLVYPPQLDKVLDENGAGIGALLLEESGKGLVVVQGESHEDQEKKRIYAKDVRKQIKEIGLGDKAAAEEDAAMTDAAGAAATAPAEVELDVFVNANGDDEGALEVYTPAQTGLFTPYFFYLSREVTRPTLEFIIRSFGGQVGWDAVLGAGSPFKEDDPRITHHIVDRPVVPGSAPRQHPGKRAYVQPQWVVDCINKKTLLPADEYGPGKALPPHLSPFVDEDEVRARGGYVPMEASRRVEDNDDIEVDNDESDDESDEELNSEEELAANVMPTVGKKKGGKAGHSAAFLAAAANPTDEELVDAAHLEAELAGVAPAVFERELAAEAKKLTKAKAAAQAKQPHKVATGQEEQLASIMLTGKERKLYNKMSYSKNRRAEETLKLEDRAKKIKQERAKAARKMEI